jgi:hypothetical protein
MILELKARHFFRTNFTAIENCVIAKVYAEATGNRCREQLDFLIASFSGNLYRHEYYGSADFAKDKAKAEAAGWDETVIRTIELTEV